MLSETLLDTLPYTFTLKPLLFAGKAMEHYGLRQGNDYDFLNLPVRYVFHRDT